MSQIAKVQIWSTTNITRTEVWFRATSTYKDIGCQDGCLQAEVQKRLGNVVRQ